MNRSFVLLMVGVMVCSVALTGCKKKKTSGIGADGINPVSGSDVYTGELSDRAGLEGGSELAGQFAAVYFDYDSAQVNPAERSKLEAVADYIRSNGSASIVVEGHSDERGSNEYNLTLGERRALAARAYLVGLGVDASRVQTRSMGEERPAAQGHDDGAWAQNRRAEFVIVQ